MSQEETGEEEEEEESLFKANAVNEEDPERARAGGPGRRKKEEGLFQANAVRRSRKFYKCSYSRETIGGGGGKNKFSSKKIILPMFVLNRDYCVILVHL